MMDWARGDTSGLLIPAHSAALRAGGASFLTVAFRAGGALAPDNSVTRITRCDECPGGSTGRKLLLSVAYERPARGLPTELFVKFSRDFDDPIRDRARNQLEAEVRLALLSRVPGFPVAVPECLFADYHRESGTGILITQRIAFGSAGIEPLHPKCLDFEMPDPLAHYQALLRTLARLAGTHKSGRLADEVDRRFPFDPEAAFARDRIRYTHQQLLNRVARYADFARAHPRLLPEHITSQVFLSRLATDVPRLLQHEQAISQALHRKTDFIALCHWNANVDNAWFWRNADGALECGLMDWGHVGQMSIALAIFSALSAAEIELWDEHLVDLLALFKAEFELYGGPLLDVQELKLHVLMFAAKMGLAWLMDAPALIMKELPGLGGSEDRFDPLFRKNETARAQLHMMTTVFNLWQREQFGRALDRFVAMNC